MEWIVLITWLMIINGGLGGQYILNWMGNKEKFVGNQPVGVSAGIMTWWREVSKLAWALIAVIVEVIRGKELKYLNPGRIAMITIIICAFTGVIENIGFFYLPRYYSPHIYAPYVNIYLAVLPFFGRLFFDAKIRKEHWIGVTLVVAGLTLPHIPQYFTHASNPTAVLDFNALLWILIINACLCSQHILNNKTVQLTKKGVGPNALVVWREIWKMVFISAAIIVFPIMANMMNSHSPKTAKADRFESVVLKKVDTLQKNFLLSQYSKSGNVYLLNKNISDNDKAKVKEIIASTDFHRFFSLFEGSLFPKNWWPILFVIAAGLTGYIYSFGFFKLSKYAVHLWVPYTNVWLGILPFVMYLFGEEVTVYQIIGAIIVTAGLTVGVLDYRKNKVEAIESKGG